MAGLLAAGALPTAIVACSGGASPSGGASTETTTSATAAASSAKAEAEPVFPEPVYPRTNDPPDPLATRLCDALHTLPAKRKAECCGGEPGFTIVSECVRTLSYALRSKAIAIDSADVDRCAEAVKKEHEGCDWVTPLSSAVPPECVGIVKGTVKEGDRCRSSLECVDGLHCHGVAASDTGRCGKPKPGGACSRGVDTLAGHTRQDDTERRHPECAGHCNGRRCEADVPIGGACGASIECGVAKWCVDKKCSNASLPAAGQPCMMGLCAGSARCFSGKCVAPKKIGEECSDDLECAGSCEKPKGAAKGACAMRCSAKIPGSTP